MYQVEEVGEGAGDLVEDDFDKVMVKNELVGILVEDFAGVWEDLDRAFAEVVEVFWEVFEVTEVFWKVFEVVFTEVVEDLADVIVKVCTGVPVVDLEVDLDKVVLIDDLEDVVKSSDLADTSETGIEAAKSNIFPSRRRGKVLVERCIVGQQRSGDTSDLV